MDGFDVELYITKNIFGLFTFRTCVFSILILSSTCFFNSSLNKYTMNNEQQLKDAAMVFLDDSSDDEMEAFVSLVPAMVERENREKVRDFVKNTVANYSDNEV